MCQAEQAQLRLGFAATASWLPVEVREFPQRERAYRMEPKEEILEVRHPHR